MASSPANQIFRCSSAVVLLLASSTTQALEPQPLTGWDYSFFTLSIATVVIYSVAMLALGAYQWLSYSLYAVIMLLLASSLDGTLAYLLGQDGDFMSLAPLMIGAVAVSYGFAHTAIRIEAPHPFIRLRRPFFGFAILGALLIPAYWVVDSWVPLFATLNTLMLLMITSSVLPPMTWRALTPVRRRLAIVLPGVTTLLVLGVYGVHFLGPGLERYVLDTFTRVLIYLYLGYAMGYAMFYIFDEAKSARDAQLQAATADREAAESTLRLLESQQEFERVQTLAQNRTQQLAEASHDIRQPIGALRRAAQELQRQSPERDAEHIVQAVDYLDQLSRSYLSIQEDDVSARGELNRTIDGLEPVNSNLVTRAVSQLHDLEAQERGVKLSVTDANASIFVQPLLLVRLLSNLISNALLHSQADHIELVTDVHGQHVHFSVRDNGIGIAPEILAQVTDPGFKGEDSEGTGLGLAIVHSHAQQQGWNLSLSSNLGNGTTITLAVPRSGIS